MGWTMEQLFQDGIMPREMCCPKKQEYKDTMHLFEIEVSENLAEKLKQREDIEILSEPEEIRFGEDGYIQE